MPKPSSRLTLSELRGLILLADAAVAGSSDIAEGLHRKVWDTLGAPPGKEAGRTRGVTGLAYQSVRGISRLLAQGANHVLHALEGQQAASAASPRRTRLLAVLNGIVGDRLAAEANPLATRMALYRAPDEEAEALPAAAGKVLLLLAPAGASELVAQIDERNLGLLQPGQPAVASADAYADQRFEARLSEVSPGVDAQRGSVEVKLAVPKPPAYLRQDMTVSVEIGVARRPQVLSLPLEAVVQADSAQPFAWVLDADDRLQRRELRLGLRAGGVVEVQQGLKAGERVLLAPERRWKDGQHLRQAGA